MDKEWGDFLGNSIGLFERTDDFEWPIWSGSFGSDQQLSVLKRTVESINNKALLLSVDAVAPETHVLHPYSIRYYNGVFLVNGFSSTTNQLEAIPVSKIKGIEPITSIPYRPPTSEQIEALSSISSTLPENNSNQQNKSVKGMNQYWQEFNNSGTHKVGNRNQWYNEVRSLRFTNLEATNAKAYFEICSQFGYRQQLIIKLIVETNKGEIDTLDPQLNSMKSRLTKSLYKSGYHWNRSNQKNVQNRRTIELINKELNIPGNKKPRDPKIFPVQPDHFKWFNDHLGKLAVIFEDYLEK